MIESLSRTAGKILLLFTSVTNFSNVLISPIDSFTMVIDVTKLLYNICIVNPLNIQIVNKINVVFFRNFSFDVKFAFKIIEQNINQTKLEKYLGSFLIAICFSIFANNNIKQSDIKIDSQT